MTIRVLVVDDSGFFRRRVSDILNAASNLEVVGTAADGEAAIRETLRLKPDVVTMDIEMPVLDGISAVRRIMAECPTPILMFSSLTHEGAKATLEALEAGAVDFLPKKFEDIARQRQEAITVLQQRVAAIARKRGVRRRTTPVARSVRAATPAPAESPALPVSRRTTADSGRYQIVAIGTSTGGPVALQTILTQLPASFPHPLVLIQHMPAAFTKAFAQRLDGLCQINVKEAEDGDILKPGVAYLAPGGKQMLVEGRAGHARLRIRADESERITYRPSVDLTLASISKVYGGDVLALILTGMGADGREGARLLKAQGATIWTQDEASCVVYGMPQAVANAGLADKNIALKEISHLLLREVGREVGH